MCGFGVKWWSIEGEKKKGVDLKHVFDSPRRPSLVATKLLLFASLFQPKANLASFKPLSLLPAQIMRTSNGHSSMDGSLNTPPPSPSQELAELLDIIDSANRPSTSSTAADALIKFMKHNKARADVELRPRNLATALKRSFLGTNTIIL